MQDKSIGELESLAAGGNASAMQELGIRYYRGIGVKTNYSRAKECFEKASQSGCKTSNYYLGVMYYNGKGTSTDHTKAKEYFEKSDADNNIFSSYYLGKIYYWGDGVEKDESKANEYKSKVLSTPFFVNQNAGNSQFYSITDIEESSRSYANAMKQKVDSEFQSLFGLDS